MKPEQRGTTRAVSVAPMMDRTDRHFRRFVRLFTRHALLYTEMVTAAAILHGDEEHLLGFSPEEHPIALQLGGDDPKALAHCARIAERRGYDEVNLNIGCPSDRVRQGRFGACLMAQPEIVRDAVSAMRESVALPVTVKCRIGIDHREEYEDLRHFVDVVADAGCDRFTIHARIAVLGGLSPRQNREVPPLRYDDVYRLRRERPHLTIELNGGVHDLDAIDHHLARVDAVMVGRAAYDRPELLREVDRRYFADPAARPTAHEALGLLVPYIEWWRERGGRVHDVTRHLLNLFAGRPGARAFRRLLSDPPNLERRGVDILHEAMAAVHEAKAAA